MSRIKLIFVLFILLSNVSSCDNQNPIPEVYVNFIIELNNPTFLPLNSVGSAVLVPYEGNKGIIVIQSNFQEFLAFDATCTYDPAHEWGRVQIDQSLISAVDTVCGSEYSLILNGAVTHGPSGLSLMQYVADFNPNLNTLHIHN
jgi:hypothetical protein